eukprot:scaffold118856_cov69-Phaeocystis_antarctica.AAC.1
MGMGWVVKMRLADSRFSNYLIVTCDDGVQLRRARSGATSDQRVRNRTPLRVRKLRFELS